MPISVADRTDLPAIRRLLHGARHSFVSFGHEDLPDLVRDAVAVLAHDAGEPWGFLLLHREERPATLPRGTAARALLRAAALARGRSPIRDIPRLMAGVEAQLVRAGLPTLMVAYRAADWLVRPLKAAAFNLHERVIFMRLTGLMRRSVELPERAEISLEAAQPDGLPLLARLDAAAFEPIWHFDEARLAGMLFTSRLQIARWRNRVAGYSSLYVQPGGEAQLARLAVHPAMRRRGIGRALLADALLYAQQQSAQEVVLNTQGHNAAAQTLYRKVGFRATGHVLPILTKTTG